MQNQVNILCNYKTKELWFSLDLGGPGGRGGGPSLVDLPTLSHHTLAAAVGALRSVRSFGHLILTARPTALARHSRLESWTVVVSIMSGEVIRIEGRVVIIVPVRVKRSVFRAVGSFRASRVRPSRRGGRVRCVSCFRCGRRK